MKALTASTIVIILTGLVTFSAEARTSQPEPTIIHLVDEFKPENAEKEVVFLRDLAKRIDSTRPELVKQLEKISVMNVLEPGETTRLSSSSIMLSIRKQGINNVSENIRIEGESVIPVFGPGHEVTVTEMVKMIHESILKETGWPEEEMVMRVLTTPSNNAWLPGKEYKTHIERVRPAVLGSSRYTLGFYINNILVEEASFIINIERRMKLFVPTRDIQRGEVILHDDVKEQIVLVDRDQIEREIAREQDEIIGHRARYTLKKNIPVKFRYLETNFVLRRGDLVQVIMQNDGFTMQTSGFAQERAAPGDIIKVKAAQTGKIVEAKVINKNIVELI